MGLQKRNAFKFRLTFILLFIFSTLFLGGCERNKDHLEEHSYVKQNQVERKKNPSFHFSVEKIKVPISSGNEKIFAVNGWLNDRKIIYQTEGSNRGSVYSYDLLTAEKKLLFTSENPIATIKISPSKKYILIHHAAKTYVGTVSIINQNGDIIVKKDIESTELEFAWNYFDEEKLLISAFNEDWTFHTYQLNIQQQSLSNVDLEEPFAFWINKDNLIYLNWDNDQPSFFAPLVKKSLTKDTASEIFPEIFKVNVFEDLVNTIKVNVEDKDHAIYTFYTNDFKKIKTLKIPQISTYTDWLVPFSDYNRSEQRFITLQPLLSGSIETYRDGFQLISYDLKSNKQETLFENLKNEPLSCSPNGMLCLYGNYFEKIIDIANKTMIDLFTY